MSMTVVLALALTACAGSAPTRYFELQTIAPDAAAGSASTLPASYRGAPLEVRAVQVPPTMDRLEIVRQLDDGEVQIREFDHWAAPLGRLARQTLTEDLAYRLPKDKLVFPGTASNEPRASLSLDILSFRIVDGVATMTMSWAVRWPIGTTSLAPAASSAASAVTMSTSRTSAGATLRIGTPSGDSATATARAWSELMAKAADRIVGDLASH